MQGSSSPPPPSAGEEEGSENALAKAMMSGYGGVPAVLLEKADFWKDSPNGGNPEAFLELAAGTEVSVLLSEQGYYKARHHNKVGYIKKSLVKILDPESPPETESTPDSEASSPAISKTSKKESSSRLVKKENDSSKPGVTPCSGAVGEELLPGVSCTHYREKVLDKVVALETYIERIIDKFETNRQKSVDLACRLFINEKAMVIATSLNNPSITRPIRKYLNSLMAMSYDKVEIEWTNIQYVSDLRKGPDGKYFGYVHIEQKFKGFLDGQLVYGDITDKIMTVVLETYETVDAQGNSNTRWDVFLSDIGVVQTRKLG